MYPIASRVVWAALFLLSSIVAQAMEDAPPPPHPEINTSPIEQDALVGQDAPVGRAVPIEQGVLVEQGVPIAEHTTSPTLPPVETPPLKPHLLELQQKLRDHPGQQSAEQRVCEAQWSILLGQSDYYPKLNATLSGGTKWIDQTTRSDEFGGSSSPEYDGDGLNATLILRQHVYDWGHNKSVIAGYRQDRFVAEIEKHETMEEHLARLISMALQYVLQVRLVAHFAEAQLIIDRDVVSMEQRYKAGAARLAEMRQARLAALEAESRLTQAERQRDLFAKAMKTEFAIEPQQAEAIVESFITSRPDIPVSVPGLASTQARLIRHNIDKAKSQDARLRAERLPRFTAVVTARGWDVGHKDRCNDVVPSTHPDRVNGRFVDQRDGTSYFTRGLNCNTYEMTGALEFSLPLYDGGANAAQRGGVAARRMGLEAELAAQIRSHDSESRRLQDELLDQLTRLTETGQRLEELETQISSERLLSTRTRGNLLNLLSLEQRLSDQVAQQLSLTFEAERSRVDALQLASRLAETLTISVGESGC